MKKRVNQIKTSTELDSTNRFVVRLWSAHYYKRKHDKHNNLYHGLVQDVVTGEEIKFHSSAQMLSILESLYTKMEKTRKKNKVQQTTNAKYDSN